MDADFIESQKAKLLLEKSRLEKQIAQSNKYPETGDDSMDDDAQETEELGNAKAAEVDSRKELEAVDAALDRIATGTYGKCAQCGDEIDKERLLAYPAANRCLKCSSK